LKTVVVIPARLESSRLPNKVLLDVCGKSLIQRVYEQVKKSRNISDIFIATDSDEVLKMVNSFGGKAILTSSKHESGTDRIAEAVKYLDIDLIINVQGDEPLINPDLIDQFVELFKGNYEVYFASAMHRIATLEDLRNPNIVKVITDIKSDAIYFSRSQIPFNREGREVPEEHFQHIGVYAYKKPFLEKYSSLSQTFLEQSEKLEQLRAIENGFKIRMIETDYRSIGVDTLDDLNRVRKLICGES
jgi:3-deoxy-manno-octulosonate cytidylyltransferase (CMP-KDO synthetase)